MYIFESLEIVPAAFLPVFLAAYSWHYSHVTAVTGRPPFGRPADFQCRCDPALLTDLRHD